jgi:4-carboxymuconolactone decarboxylase
MSRLPPLELADLTGPQREVYDQIAKGPRGRVRGPLLAWLHSPGFTQAAHPIGEYLRYESLLSGRLAELAICIVARFWDANFEWFVHAPLAEKSGVAKQVLNAIAQRNRPRFDSEDEECVWQVTTQMLATGQVQDGAFERAKDVLGVPVLVELSGLIGYYSLGAFTLNLFRIEPPAGEGPLLPSSEFSAHPRTPSQP